MSADSGARGRSFLLIAVLAVTGYVAWQVAPLSERMDALDRDRLETRDRLQRQIEQLRDQFERARLGGGTAGAVGLAPQSQPGRATPRDTASASPTQAAAPQGAPARVSRMDAETYFAGRLLPEDATIASLLVGDVSVPMIAQRLKHSPAFIVAKGIQIEKQLAAAPDTPPDILAALRAAVERAKAKR